MSIELPVTTRHRRDMTEKLLKATLKPNSHTHTHTHTQMKKLAQSSNNNSQNNSRKKQNDADGTMEKQQPITVSDDDEVLKSTEKIFENLSSLAVNFGTNFKI